jgi:predicted acyltransferase
VDDRGWRTPVKPLVILGMNSIAVYVAAELLDTMLYLADVRDAIYETAFVPFASAANASLLYACAYTLVMLALAWTLYRRRIFIRI